MTESGPYRVIVDEASLMAGMIVGIAGEHDPLPEQYQLNRAVNLIMHRNVCAIKQEEFERWTAMIRDLARQITAPGRAKAEALADEIETAFDRPGQL